MILGTGIIGLVFSVIAALILGNLLKDDGAGFGAGCHVGRAGPIHRK